MNSQEEYLNAQELSAHQRGLGSGQTLPVQVPSDVQLRNGFVSIDTQATRTQGASLRIERDQQNSRIGEKEPVTAEKSNRSDENRLDEYVVGNDYGVDQRGRNGRINMENAPDLGHTYGEEPNYTNGNLRMAGLELSLPSRRHDQPEYATHGDFVQGQWRSASLRNRQLYGPAEDQVQSQLGKQQETSDFEATRSTGLAAQPGVVEPYFDTGSHSINSYEVTSSVVTPVQIESAQKSNEGKVKGFEAELEMIGANRRAEREERPVEVQVLEEGKELPHDIHGQRIPYMHASLPETERWELLQTKGNMNNSSFVGFSEHANLRRPVSPHAGFQELSVASASLNRDLTMANALNSSASAVNFNLGVTAGSSSLHSRTLGILRFSNRQRQARQKPETSPLRTSVERQPFSDDKKRSKSHGGGKNRKYCINKLFQKAMGVGLDQYRRAQEYRDTNEFQASGKQTSLGASMRHAEGRRSKSGSPLEAVRKSTSLRRKDFSPAQNLVQTPYSNENCSQPLRVKSRSRSSNRQRHHAEPNITRKQAVHEQRAASNLKQKLTLDSNRGPTTSSNMLSSSKVTGSKSKESKVQRYKQIEKELEHDRRVQELEHAERQRELDLREAELRREQELRALEELRRREIDAKRELEGNPERERLRRIERERLEKEENERQRRFVEETMVMMRKFEEEHPHLHSDRSPRFNQTQTTSHLRMQTQKEGESQPMNHRDGTNERDDRNYHTLESWKETEHRRPPVQSNHSLRDRSKHSGRARDQSSGTYIDSQDFGGHFDNVPAQQSVVENPRSYHQSSGQWPNLPNAYVSVQQVGSYGDNAAVHQLGDMRQESNYTLGGRDPASHTGSRAAEYIRVSSSHNQSSFQLHPDESLLGLNRSNLHHDYGDADPIPSHIHRGEGPMVDHFVSGRSSHASLRTKNERLRVKYQQPEQLRLDLSEDTRATRHLQLPEPYERVREERSRSIPDTVPCRGPTAQNTSSSPIGDMDLKSTFGKRQQISGRKVTEVIASGRLNNPRQVTEPDQSQPSLRTKSYDAPAGPRGDNSISKFNIVPVFHMRIQDQQAPYLGIRDSSTSSLHAVKSKRSRSSGHNRQSSLIAKRDKVSKALLLKQTQHEVQNCITHLNTNIEKCEIQRKSKPEKRSGKGHPITGQKDNGKFHIVELDEDQYIDTSKQDLPLLRLDTHSQSTLGQSSRAANGETAISHLDHSLNAMKISQGLHPRDGQTVAYSVESLHHQQMNPRQFLNQTKQENVVYSEHDPSFSRPSNPSRGSVQHQLSKQEPRHASKNAARVSKSKEERDKIRKSRKIQREKDMQKLMKLQVQQASMLMDLIRRTAQGDDETDLKSSMASHLQHKTSQAVSASMISSKSRVSALSSQQSGIQHKSTVDLIQAIYKQMEKINNQLGKKDQSNQGVFQDLEKKMKKLTKKYHQISIGQSTSENRRDKKTIDQPKTYNELEQVKGTIKPQATTQISRHIKSIEMSSERNCGIDSQSYTIRTEMANIEEMQARNAQYIADRNKGKSKQNDDLSYEMQKALDADEQLIQDLTHEGETVQQNFMLNDNSEFTNSAGAKILTQRAGEMTAHRANDFNCQFPSVYPSSAKSGLDHFYSKRGSQQTNNNLMQQILNSQELEQQQKQQQQAQMEMIVYPENTYFNETVQINQSEDLRNTRKSISRNEFAEIKKYQLNTTQEQRDDQAWLGVENALSQTQPLSSKNDSGAVLGHMNKDKLQTIQSVPTNEGGASKNNSFDNSKANGQLPRNTLETAGISTRQLDEQKEIAKHMETQISGLNSAICELRTDHNEQLTSLKDFYNEQINQIRQQWVSQQQPTSMQPSSCAPAHSQHQIYPPAHLAAQPEQQQVANEMLSKLMNQDQFKETIQQLNKAVGQKELLEEKLNRIKEKIQRAKRIRENPAFLAPYGQSLHQSDHQQATMSQTASDHNVVTLQRAAYGGLGGEREDAHQAAFRFFSAQSSQAQLPMALQQYSMSNSVGAMTPQQLQSLDHPSQADTAKPHVHQIVDLKGQDNQFIKIIAQAASLDSSPLVESEHVSLRAPKEETPQSYTLNHAVSGNIQAEQRPPTQRVESQREFEQRLNYDYVSKDLIKKKLKQSQQESQSSLSHKENVQQQQPYQPMNMSSQGPSRQDETSFSAHDRFMHTFNPVSSAPAESKATTGSLELYVVDQDEGRREQSEMRESEIELNDHGFVGQGEPIDEPELQPIYTSPNAIDLYLGNMSAKANPLTADQQAILDDQTLGINQKIILIQALNRQSHRVSSGQMTSTLELAKDTLGDGSEGAGPQSLNPYGNSSIQQQNRIIDPYSFSKSHAQRNNMIEVPYIPFNHHDSKSSKRMTSIPQSIDSDIINENTQRIRLAMQQNTLHQGQISGSLDQLPNHLGETRDSRPINSSFTNTAGNQNFQAQSYNPSHNQSQQVPVYQNPSFLSIPISPSVQTFSTDLIKPHTQLYQNMNFAKREDANQSTSSRDVLYMNEGTETERESAMHGHHHIGIGLQQAESRQNLMIPGHYHANSGAATRTSQPQSMSVTLNRRFADTYKGDTMGEQFRGTGNLDCVQRVIQVAYVPQPERR